MQELSAWLGKPFTLWSLAYVVILVILLFYVAGTVRAWIANKALARTRLDRGESAAAGSK